MDNKIDGVKISVKNDNIADSVAKSEENSEVKKTKRKTRARAAVPRIKKTAVKKEIKKTPQKNEDDKPGKVKGKKEKGSFFKNLISIILTALLVSAFMYVWKDREIEKVEKKAEGETASVKTDLENRLSSLKSKVTGMETNTVELKNTLEEFKKKAELLIGAKKEYTNNDLGVSFEYPATFGTVMVSTSSLENSGIVMSFENNEKLFIAGVNGSYEKSSTSTSVAMKEIKGFSEKKDKYYLLGPNKSQEYEIKPAQTINADGGKAVLIDKNSFVLAPGTDGVPVDIGDNVAFVINLKDRQVPALVIVNSDFGMMPLNDFVLMMETFEVR